MPRYILKINDGSKDYYLLWSTVVDAPVTQGMSLREFKKYYQSEYGEQGMINLPPTLRYSFSLSLNSATKCQGNISR